jgi:hypothetical protein
LGTLFASEKSVPVALIPACCVRPVPGYGRAFCAPAAAKDWAMSIGDITAVIMVVCYLTWVGLWLRSNKWDDGGAT